MKNKLNLLILVTVAALAGLGTAQLPFKTDLVWSVGFTGTPAEQDIEAAKVAIDAYNNQFQTALPYETGPELKASYLTILAQVVDTAHSRHQAMAADRKHQDEKVRERWILSTPTQRQAALDALAALPAPPPQE